MSTHQITATRGGANYAGDWENEFKIKFTYHPAVAPRLYGDAPQPGEPTMIEFLSAAHEDGTPADEDEREWCEEWLAKHEDEAIAAAIHDREAAREYAAEMRAELAREDRREGWR